MSRTDLPKTRNAGWQNDLLLKIYLLENTQQTSLNKKLILGTNDKTKQ